MNQKKEINARVEALRHVMNQQQIDAFIVPGGDAHLSEYVPERWAGREWISGFTGSAGNVMITQQEAGLWTDSRYFLQGAQELEGTCIQLFKEGVAGVPYIEEYLTTHFKAGATVGVDGACFSLAALEDLEKNMAAFGIKVEARYDLLDEIWQGRPSVPTNPFFEHPVEYSGEPTKDRIQRINQELAKKGANAQIMVMVDELCWAFNIRNNDVSYNPVGIGFGYIDDQQALLFTLPEKVSDNLRNNLSKAGIEVRPYDDFYQFLTELSADRKILVDRARMTAKAFRSIPAHCQIIEQISPITMMKSIKTDAEVAGIHRSMKRDGVALARFFMWLEKALADGEKITEYEAGEKLTAFRAEQEHYVSDSFATICGYMDHGAIVHFRATPENSNVIKPEGILLLDSGGQYLDGTTDITRTIAVGKTTQEQIDDWTLVLKGHIAIATARFPLGTRGNQLDILARKAMWDRGISYGHGTGHGVGCFMNVHEGPQNIRTDNNPTPMGIGTFTSNEPGLYRSGKHGIRLENLILTVVKEETEFGTFLGFDTATVCFFDNSLVNIDMLTDQELAWYNDYQKFCYDTIADELTADEQAWLRNKTLPLCR